MRTVQVCIDLDDEDYLAYESEAQREGTTAQALIQQVVRSLFTDLKQEEEDGTHPIIFP